MTREELSALKVGDNVCIVLDEYGQPEKRITAKVWWATKLFVEAEANGRSYKFSRKDGQRLPRTNYLTDTQCWLESEGTQC